MPKDTAEVSFGGELRLGQILSDRYIQNARLTCLPLQLQLQRQIGGQSARAGIYDAQIFEEDTGVFFSLGMGLFGNLYIGHPGQSRLDGQMYYRRLLLA